MLGSSANYLAQPIRISNVEMAGSIRETFKVKISTQDVASIIDQAIDSLSLKVFFYCTERVIGTGTEKH